MFEITHEQLRDRSFLTAMQKVQTHEMTDFKKAYNLSRMGTQLALLQKDADEVFEKLIKSHGTVDKENQRYEIKDEKLDSWKKAVEEFQSHSVKVERHKIRVEELEGIPLTPTEVAALEPVLDGLAGLSN